jgi:DNA-binding NarL/FixJ family response regulator
MSHRNLNVYILNDDASTAGKLRKYLKHRFGKDLNISLFFSVPGMLRMIDNHVDLVVVDNDFHTPGGTQKVGIDVLKNIKENHPSTEVVILSNNEDVGTKIEAIKGGARDYILNKRGAFHQLRVILDQTINQPIRYLVAEYGVRTFVLIFLLVWGLLGFISWLALRLWRNDLV